jgi:pimeloyl-ACP methyl ester carboxylesterase
VSGDVELDPAAALAAWRAGGTTIDVDGTPVFVHDSPAQEELGNPPLLVLHGFPTAGYDYAGVLPALGAGRRVLLPDLPGHGLSGKPDRRYGIRWFADCVEGAVAALGVDEVDLLTHDVGDSVGGELLARSLEGALGFAVRRRAITNGSIYMDLVQLSQGQQLLLSLPDEPTDLVGHDGWIAGLRSTFAPGSPVTDEELEVHWHLTAHDGGHRMLPRAIRYIEDRRAEERRYTEPIEVHPSPLGIVWGALDPIAVVAMAHRLHERAAGSELVVLDDIGHYPMLEAPERFGAAVLRSLGGGLDTPAAP